MIEQPIVRQDNEFAWGDTWLPRILEAIGGFDGGEITGLRLEFEYGHLGTVTIFQDHIAATTRILPFSALNELADVFDLFAVQSLSLDIHSGRFVTLSCRCGALRESIGTVVNALLKANPEGEPSHEPIGVTRRPDAANTTAKHGAPAPTLPPREAPAIRNHYQQRQEAQQASRPHGEGQSPAQPSLEVVRLEIAKLELRPGDVLVVKTPNSEGWVSDESFAFLRKLADDNLVLFVGGDTELSVIHPVPTK